MYNLSLFLIFMHCALLAYHEVTPDEIRRYSRDLKHDAANFVEICRIFGNETLGARADRLMSRLNEFTEHLNCHEPYEWSSREKFGSFSIEYHNIEYFLQHNEVEESIGDVFNRMASVYWELSSYYSNPIGPHF